MDHFARLPTSIAMSLQGSKRGLGRKFDLKKGGHLIKDKNKLLSFLLLP